MMSWNLFIALCLFLDNSWHVNAFNNDVIFRVISKASNGTVDSFRGCSSMFGPSIELHDITGIVVVASPLNGCTPLTEAPFQRNDSLVWIALIARDTPHDPDGCTFAEKVLNAQRAHFGAVLVYNYEDSLTPMASTDKRGKLVDIPSAFIGFSDGMDLIEKYSYQRVSEAYRIDGEFLFPFDPNVYIIPFVIIVAICFLLFTILWIVKWCRDWRHRQRNRLSKSSLKKLAQKKFEKGTDPYECCAICLDDYESGDKLRILPCNHAYHTKCIDPWLLKNKSTCPVCKRRVFPKSERRGSDSSSESDEEAPASSGASAANERTPLLQQGSSNGSQSYSSSFDNQAVVVEVTPPAPQYNTQDDVHSSDSSSPLTSPSLGPSSTTSCSSSYDEAQQDNSCINREASDSREHSVEVHVHSGNVKDGGSSSNVV